MLRSWYSTLPMTTGEPRNNQEPTLLPVMAEYAEYKEFVHNQIIIPHASEVRSWNLLMNLSVFAVRGTLDPYVSRITNEANIEPFMYICYPFAYKKIESHLVSKRHERRDFQFMSVDTNKLQAAMAKKDQILQYGKAKDSYRIVDHFLASRLREA